MSREIKFRAWDDNAKRWLSRGESVTMPLAFKFTDELKAEANFYIEQYTGLKDKNGKEIYEGDIMRFDAIDYEIYWSSEFSGWHNRRIDKGERIYGSNSFEEVTRFGSVIGNIHENPETLGGEE